MELELARAIVFAKDMGAMTRFYDSVVGLARVESAES